MRMTHALVEVALALMEDPYAEHWGYELSKRARVRSGVLYPILRRMEADGWITDGWEDPKKITGKRPPRRYYQLTDKGLEQLGALIEQAHRDARFDARFGVATAGGIA